MRAPTAAPPDSGPALAEGPVSLADYDLILVNSSAGKDSQAMLSALVARCDREGIDRARIVVVHADLGRAEWAGTRDLAQEHAATYGLRFEVVTREKGDLLDQIEARGMFPSSAARYCTSDQKTSQVAKLMTRLANEHRAAGNEQPLWILNCLGIRAQESPARAKKQPFGRDNASQALFAVTLDLRVRPNARARRFVHRWLPIFDWTSDQVWSEIRRSGLRHHPAYDQGMSRLSCVFCVLAGRRDLVLAARLNPALAGTYAALEERIGHTFTADLSMAEILAAAAAPDPPTAPEQLDLFTGLIAHRSCAA